MTTHSESRAGQPRARTVARRARRVMILLRVLGLCANSVALAQGTLPAPSAVTPEQKFPPGYLESVATGYENGQQPMLTAEGVAPLRPRAATTRMDQPGVPPPMGQARAVTTAAPAPAAAMPVR